MSDVLPGKLLVGVCQAPNGERLVVYNVDPRAAIRILVATLEDLRDGLYQSRNNLVETVRLPLLEKP